ncbi:hypothetical protein [Kitasatospora sp. KL5]|uniref:hypothetical protein n=1 Tax=Kitasatospora sp. KL5 TaxID=3425125 RepID=UPI003D6DE3A6
MATVVMIHGIWYTYASREGMHREWYQALRTGMIDAGLEPPGPAEVAAAFYGNCFRSKGTKSGGSSDDVGSLPPYQAGEVEAGFELELLQAMAASLPTGGTAKGVVGDLLRKLEVSKFLGDVPAKAVIWFVKQVHRYLTDGTLRRSVLDQVSRTVTAETRVIVAHSLGSVVAYEALCENPDWNVDTLVTLGSPLGMEAVASRLQPPVRPGAEAVWPGTRRWVNVAAQEDPVALLKELGPVFGKDVEDRLVGNGLRNAHSVVRYLTTRETAEAVAGACGHR